MSQFLRDAVQGNSENVGGDAHRAAKIVIECINEESRLRQKLLWPRLLTTLPQSRPIFAISLHSNTVAKFKDQTAPRFLSQMPFSVLDVLSAYGGGHTLRLDYQAASGRL